MRCSQRALLSRWLRFYARTRLVRPISFSSSYVSPSPHPAAIAPAAPVGELGFVRPLHNVMSSSRHPLPVIVGFIVAGVIVAFTLGMCARGEVWSAEHRRLPSYLVWPLNAALALRPHLWLLSAVAGLGAAGLVFALRTSRNENAA